MLLYYVRHGDPIYSPNSLTPLGERQAEAVAKRLSRYGLDEIYVSSSNRAKQTAKPTCEMLKKEPVEIDWANENYAWDDFSVEQEGGGRQWVFHIPHYAELFNSNEVRNLGDRWYEHPAFKDTNVKDGIMRIESEADKFFENLGYKHDRNRHLYVAEKPNDKRIAIFAHQGFGVLFLSSILDICVPQFITHFDLCHSSVTVIEFGDMDGISIPRALTVSNDSHIYEEGLPTKYNNEIYL
ncbi:MAG: histidine phosphatase family protein [Firmicutes bacterium]|nr:histidine phosphatase family protein [Bacillota bacterium]